MLFTLIKNHTCDYKCQITEFTCWAIISIRNQQSYEGRFEEIKKSELYLDDLIQPNLIRAENFVLLLTTIT